jgi:hypothetical protein
MYHDWVRSKSNDNVAGKPVSTKTMSTKPVSTKTVAAKGNGVGDDQALLARCAVKVVVKVAVKTTLWLLSPTRQAALRGRFL